MWNCSAATARVSIVSLVALFGLITEAHAWHFSNENTYQVDLSTANGIVQKSGTSSQVQGKLTGIKSATGSTISGKDLAKQIRDDQLEIHAYFPDFTQDVTSDVKLSANTQSIAISYQTPPIQAESLNTMIVQIKHASPDTDDLQKVDAKIDFKILSLRLWIQALEKSHAGQKTIKGLRETLAQWIAYDQELEAKIKASYQVVAEMRLPLQVDNELAQASSKSYIANHFLFSISYDLGSAIQGDSTVVTGSISWAGCENHHLPAIEPEYTASYLWNGNIVQRISTQKLDPAKPFLFDYVTPKLSRSTANVFSESLESKVPKGKGASSPLNLGTLTLTEPVAVDTTAPTWLPGATPDSSHDDVQSLQPVSATVQDSFGRIDRASIRAILSGTEVSGRIINQDVTDSLTLTPSDRGATYAITGDLNPLNDGSYTLKITAQDLAGNAAQPYIYRGRIDHTPPTINLLVPDHQRLTDSNWSVPVTVYDQSPVTTKIIWNGVTVAETKETNFTVPLTLITGLNHFAAYSTDAAGNTTGPVELTDIVFAVSTPSSSPEPSSSPTVQPSPTVTPSPSPTISLPPDPASIAPPVASGSSGSIGDSVKFIYEGDNPIQTGVQPGVIQADRATLTRGSVLGVDSKPLSGVLITIQGHPELGQTLSRSNGQFDLVVNGGGQLTFNYQSAGYLPVQRSVTVNWNDATVLPDVVMTQTDAKVTSVSMNVPKLQVHQSTPVTDEDGTRAVSLMFPAGTQAQLVMSDGSRQSIANLSIRATEFTVGDNGPKAMPGSLPPYSAYTYAADFSADEALMMGAKTVEFNQPIPVYVDNFLNFPVGAILPLGYYDKDKAAWLALDNGLVVQIVGIDQNGRAQLAVDDTGVPANVSVLSALGISDDERGKLLELYPVGKTLQRVQVNHFSAFDINLHGTDTWAPSIVAATLLQPINNGCVKAGSRIECQNQILGESIPISGTNFSLSYGSDRAGAPVVIDIPVTNSHPNANLPPYGGGSASCTTNSQGQKVCAVPPPPPVLYAEAVQVTIAGRRFEAGFTPDPHQTAHFVWDRKDAFGRVLTGSQKAHVQIAYMYQQGYAIETLDTTSGSINLAGQQRLFGVPYEIYPGHGSYFEGRTKIPGVREYDVVVGSIDSKMQLGLGGWSLSPVHVYDYTSKTVNLGDGSHFSSQNEDVENLIVNRVAGIAIPGGGFSAWNDSDNGKSALDVPLNAVYGIAFAPDGSMYLASGVYILKISTDGTIRRFAGTWPPTSSSDDGVPATQANLTINSAGLAVGPDGSVYLAGYTSNKVWKITPDGIIHVFAGNGRTFQNAPSGSVTDGFSATQAVVVLPTQVAVGQDGNVYIGSASSCVRYVSPDGIIHSLLPTCLAAPDDGGYSNYTSPANSGLAVDSAGNVYYAGTEAMLRKMNPSGTVAQISPNGQFDFSHIFVDAQGFLYLAEYLRNSVYRYNPNLSWSDGLAQIAGLSGQGPGYSGEGELALNARFSNPIAAAISPDGGIFVADFSNHIVRKLSSAFPGPNHAVNIVASTDGSEVYVFNPNGNISKTLDGLTGATIAQFTYDSSLRLTQILDRDGNATLIERDSSGNPLAIVGPYGHRTSLTVDGQGFLNAVTTPSGKYALAYQEQTGLLTSFVDANQNVHTFTYDDHGRLTADQDPGNGLQTLRRTMDLDTGAVSITHQTRLGRSTSYQVFVDQKSMSEVRVNTYPDGTQDQVTIAPVSGVTTRYLRDGTVVTGQNGADARYGMQAPIIKNAIVRLPSGLTSNYSESSQYQSQQTQGANFVSVYQSTLNQKTTASSYDSSSRTLTVTSPMGRITSEVLDDKGRVVQSTHGNLAPNYFSYDTRGRLTTITQGPRIYQFGYGVDGQLATMTDPLTQLTSLFYDGAARLVQQTLPGNRDVFMGYDANSNVTSITPPGKATHSFKYTGLDFAQSYTAPTLPNTESITQWGYSADRELTDVSFPGSRSIHFNYDQVTGQLTSVTTPDGDIASGYNPTTGQLVSLTTPEGGVLSFSYDGSLLTKQQWSGAGIHGSVTFAYNADFGVKTEAVSGGQSVDRAYDNDGLLTQAGSLSLTRDPQNGFVTGTSNGVVSESYGYTSFAEIVSHSANRNGSQVYSASYTQDALGRISSQTETILGVSHTYGYTYDNAQRLSQVTRDGSVVSSYSYDSNGNRVTAMVGGVSSSATYDAQDRLMTYGPISYAYNPQGQLVSKTDSSKGQVTSYNYDVLGNLRAVTMPDGKMIRYAVDGTNRRIGKQVNGTLVQGFLYLDDLRIAAELDGSGNITSQFVYGDKSNVPAYMIRAGVTYQIVSDHVGSPRLVVNTSDGSVAQQVEYDEFGNVLADSRPGFQPFGFAGGLYDPETGLTHFGARDYDASVGKWLQKDPILFAGGDTNLYGYSMNDPVNFVDPWGLDDVNVALLIVGYQNQAKRLGNVTPLELALRSRLVGNVSQDAADAEHYLFAQQLVKEGHSIPWVNALVFGYQFKKIAYTRPGETTPTESQLIWGLGGANSCPSK